MQKRSTLGTLLFINIHFRVIVLKSLISRTKNIQKRVHDKVGFTFFAYFTAWLTENERGVLIFQ